MASSSRSAGLVVAVLLGVLAGAGAMWVALRPAAVAAPPVITSAPHEEHWQCPMHPAVIQDHPGTCPICGMKLVKQATAQGSEADAGVQGRASVTIDASRQQLIGLRTVEAAVGPVSEQLRTTGRVEIDPTRVRAINVKIEGYVERVFVDFVGRPVRKGEPLFSLYSPQLLAAQSEYLLALQTQEALAKGGASPDDGAALVSSAKKKLELWDVPPAALEQLERTRQPVKALTFLSPISGVVTAKKLVEGSRLAPGDVPYEVTDLSMVWVMADVYESELSRVKVGLPATLTLGAYPNRPFRGEVAFIDPVFDAATRTARVHLHFNNPSGELKPEMFGEVLLETAARSALRVPTDTIVHSGTREVVFVSRGEGVFEPRAVQLGTRSGEWVELLDGVRAGEKVVSRANFLIDSESQLRSSLSNLKEP